MTPAMPYEIRGHGGTRSPWRIVMVERHAIDVPLADRFVTIERAVTSVRVRWAARAKETAKALEEASAFLESETKRMMRELRQHEKDMHNPPLDGRSASGRPRT